MGRVVPSHFTVGGCEQAVKDAEYFLRITKAAFAEKRASSSEVRAAQRSLDNAKADLKAVRERDALLMKEARARAEAEEIKHHVGAHRQRPRSVPMPKLKKGRHAK